MFVIRGLKDDDSWNLLVYFKSDILLDWNYILIVVNWKWFDIIWNLILFSGLENEKKKDLNVKL